MHDRWNESLSLQVLSDETGIHPVTISYYFPKYFACTFGAYMRKLKVSHALTLMKAGNTSLTSIAYECGFADQSHFIHTFKNLTGFLPAKYRKLYSPRQRQ
jgi:AraC family transcriptional regulator